MRRDNEARDFSDMSVPEKILHVQDLWDQIASVPDDVELTDAQREEIERRLRAHEQEPGDYTSWKELRRQLERKYP